MKEEEIKQGKEEEEDKKRGIIFRSAKINS